MPKRWICSQGKFLIQDWVYFDNTVYTIVGIAYMSKQRTRKLCTKIISDAENNFTQNKYNELQKNKW